MSFSLIIEGNLEIKLPTIWTYGRWKSRGGKRQRGEEKKREDQRGERVRRKKMQVHEKVGQSRFFSVFFQWFVAPEGRKVGSLKQRARSHVVRWEMTKCTLLWREAHFQVKMLKAPHVRTAFESWDGKKVRTVVARSRFPVQNALCSDHFWKLRCRKSAHSWGAKHVSKSKCTKHTMLGPLLEVEMSKKCTRSWREAHCQVKMLKTPHVRTTFGRSGVVLCGRRRGLCSLSKVSKTWRFCSTFNYNHQYTTTTLHYTNYNYTSTTTTTTLHYTHYNYNKLHTTTTITLPYPTPH